MRTCPAKRLRSVLLRKGFQEEKTHHLIYWLMVGGKRTAIRTRLSHGIREYGPDLLAEVARALLLSKGELDRFIRCPMSHQEYLGVLHARGEL